jgi:hypothetical protein
LRGYVVDRHDQRAASVSGPEQAENAEGAVPRNTVPMAPTGSPP